LKAITVSMEAGAQLLSDKLITPQTTCCSPATSLRGARRNHHAHGTVSGRVAPALRQPVSELNEIAAIPSIMHTEATPAQADVSELDLVKQCQAGDTEAFDQLVGRYRTRVLA